MFAAAAEIAKEGVPVVAKPYTPPPAALGGQLTMSKFFIIRPIVAMVIAILMVLGGGVAMLELPTAQFRNIADPMIQVKATYPGADAQTIAESVATPIEQQMSGVSGMNYMYSLSASSWWRMSLYVDFQLGTDVNTDQIPGADAARAGQFPAALRGHPARRNRSAGYDGAFYAP